MLHAVLLPALVSGLLPATPVSRVASVTLPAVPASAPAPASVSAAPSRSSAKLPDLAIDSLVLEKAAHRLTLYLGGTVVRTYQVALGRDPLGRKERVGDMRTPEGLYHIDWKNPNSQFHLALHVSYPSAADRARAAADGVSPGGDIMLHGLPNGQGWVGEAHRKRDWTNGCIAVTDQEIEEIFRAVPVGAAIDIRR